MNTEENDHLKLDFSEWKCRCSSITKLMTSPDKNELSVGAKTYIEGQVDEMLYKFSEEIDTKETNKGTNGENESIGIHNQVYFTNYRKSQGAKENDYLTTESCDIDDPENDLVIDIKTPWSKKSFPKTIAKAIAKAKKAGYPDQLQGYMTIYGRSSAKVSFNLIDTPEELCGYEDPSLHIVEHLPIELRNTTISYVYNQKLELQMHNKVVLARVHMQAYYLEILRDHGLTRISEP